MNQSDNTLDFIQLETGGTPDACVIWLHGLGADGHDFVPVVEQLRLPDTLSLRFIFPNAPARPITINNGYIMPGWYDIFELDVVSREDVAGIEQSSASIDRLIKQQLANGIMADRVLLAGFSQGGVIALHCGLGQYTFRLGGIMSLSSYLPGCAKFCADHKIPLFLGHGRMDSVVPINRGRESCNRLEIAGYCPEWHEYDMEHSVCRDEISDIRRWLLGCLCR